jgi:mannose/fructose/N-acetylgalactosamine-specific phosphotransferase system component IIC
MYFFCKYYSLNYYKQVTYVFHNKVNHYIERMNTKKISFTSMSHNLIHCYSYFIIKYIHYFYVIELII